MGNIDISLSNHIMYLSASVNSLCC